MAYVKVDPSYCKGCQRCMEVCRQSLPQVYRHGTHEIACHLFVGKENVTSDGEEVMRI